MTLLEAWLDITSPWRKVFAHKRTATRAIRHGLFSLVCIGTATVSRILWASGRQNMPWQTEYHLFSRADWNAQELFEPVLQKGLSFCPGELVGVAIDDTKVRKTGHCIQQAFMQRDPMSPPYHVNLILGLRFLQASLLVPLYNTGDYNCRALPIRFEESSAVKRPSRRADEEEWTQYRQQRKEVNLSTHFVGMMGQLRAALDAAGAQDKTLVTSTDGSFCNRTVFTAERDRTEIIARARKDASLCFHAPQDSRRFYDQAKFTPEQVRQDDKTYPWRTANLFYGGAWREVRCKVLTNVLWQGGARRQPLRLIVVAPTPYQKRKSAKMYYRQPAYLLTTDLEHAPEALLQIYLDRWQIEVNHREEKDTLGVGEAQLWNKKAVPRQPALVVAAYSALLLASLIAFGPGRDDNYAPLPRWRRNAKRPSCLDLVTLLRKEIDENPELVAILGANATRTSMAAAAAA